MKARIDSSRCSRISRRAKACDGLQVRILALTKKTAKVQILLRSSAEPLSLPLEALIPLDQPRPKPRRLGRDEVRLWREWRRILQQIG